MAWRVLIAREVRGALGQRGLSREGLLQALVALHHHLPREVRRFRERRDPKDPDSFFLFRVGFPDGALWHRFTFWVDDATRPNHLLVENLAHETRPIDP
jgi:hypothetical protein